MCHFCFGLPHSAGLHCCTDGPMPLTFPHCALLLRCAALLCCASLLRCAASPAAPRLLQMDHKNENYNMFDLIAYRIKFVEHPHAGGWGR